MTQSDWFYAIIILDSWIFTLISTIIYGRKKESVVRHISFNLILGLTGVGWVIALIGAVKKLI